MNSLTRRSKNLKNLQCRLRLFGRKSWTKSSYTVKNSIHMFSLLRACRKLLLYCLILAWPRLLFAQMAVPEGPEYSVLGSLFGEQTFPQISLTPAGGYVVWQDNALDGKGLGIGAQRLDSTATAVGDPFPVNQVIGGDQTKPTVAVLSNGNTLFAWQSGKTGFPYVYARVLGNNGRFLTNDVRLGPGSRATTTRKVAYMSAWQNNRNVLKQFTFKTTINKARVQDQNAAAASLGDGAVVVYSGIRRDITNKTQLVRQVLYIRGRPYTNSVLQTVRTRLDWMREIYFQRLSANGAKLGPEVVVNQFHPFNQREPAVATLDDGTFVVVWVSEEQFRSLYGNANYIVIKARKYNASGEPLGDEFRIDGTDAAVCASPAVGSAAGGGFTVVWNQMDRSRTNGWDIYGRTFGSSGAATSLPFRINAHTYGDQIQPDISGSGVNQLVVWTSLGQDGSREGVYGHLLASGIPVGGEFRVNTTTRAGQIHPTVASYGNDHFVALWASFTGLAGGYDLMGQRFAAAQPPPAPAPPSVTPVSSQSLLVAWPEISDASLENYELFVDGAINPVTVLTNSWVAGGFDPSSTHSFRLAYRLDGVGRSALSEPASGTTLSTNEATSVKSENRLDAINSGGSTATSAGAPYLKIAVTDKGITLRWSTESGGIYQVQMSTNLSSWQDVGAPQIASGLADYKTLEAASGPRFYRVMRTR